MLRPALLETNDVVDARPRERGELLAPEARGAASTTARKPYLGRVDAVAPRPQEICEFAHTSIFLPDAATMLVLLVPPSRSAWASAPPHPSIET
jgi:hypothetical protein